MAENFFGLQNSSYKANIESKKVAERFYENLAINKYAMSTHKEDVKKKKVDVLLDGVIYTLVSSEDESYMQKVAFYLNQKLNETRKLDSSRNLDLRAVALLTSLNIADDYCKLLDESNNKAIDIKKLESEVEIYKREYANANKENELLKAEIENLKMQLLKAEAKNSPKITEN